MPAKDPAVHREYKRKYNRKYYIKNLIGGATNYNNHKAGAIAEHMVAADLYGRGAIEITWPDDQHCSDDMHARFLNGWYSVQVKCGRENRKTGALVSVASRKNISSHILAVVSIRTGKIRYLPNKKELPEGLRASI